MAKKHKKEGVRGKAEQTQTAPPPPPRKGILRRIIGLLSPTGWFWASVSLIIGLIGFYYLLRPQIGVEPDTAINPKQPMTTPFRITNRGVLPIYNVHKECGIAKLASDQSANFTFSAVTFIDATDPIIPRLDEGESTSVFVANHLLSSSSEQQIESGDIYVMVKYTTAIIGIHKTQTFRFETRKDINNEIRWYHKASSE